MFIHTLNLLICVSNPYRYLHFFVLTCWYVPSTCLGSLCLQTIQVWLPTCFFCLLHLFSYYLCFKNCGSCVLNMSKYLCVQSLFLYSIVSIRLTLQFFWGGCNSSVVSSAPTILWPRVQIPSTSSMLFSICIFEIVTRKERK